VKKGGLVIALGLGKPKAGGDDEESEDYSGDENVAGEELGEILGVSEDKMGAFQEALHAYVSACMKK
jgi:hypothetical protein